MKKPFVKNVRRVTQQEIPEKAFIAFKPETVMGVSPSPYSPVPTPAAFDPETATVEELLKEGFVLQPAYFDLSIGKRQQPTWPAVEVRYPDNRLCHARVWFDAHPMDGNQSYAVHAAESLAQLAIHKGTFIRWQFLRAVDYNGLA